MSDVATCVVVDRHPATCLAYQRFWKRVRVIDFAHEAPGGLALAHDHHPDVVVMSLGIGGSPWLAANQITATTQSAVLFVTDRTSSLLVDLALASGGNGIVSAAEPITTIEAAALQAANGRRYFGSLWEDRAEEILAGAEMVTSLLTEQEEQTLYAIALGLSHEEMAELWKQTDRTVRRRVSSLHERFSAETEKDVIVRAVAEGLFGLETFE